VRKQITIRELARLSGVSIGTVSRALNGYPDVGPDTRERILLLAEELDYTPAAAARTLVTQRSHVIGVFLETGRDHPHLQHPFFHEVLAGIKERLGAAGYDLLLFASEHPGNGFGPHSYLKRCRHHHVDGAILMGLTSDDVEVQRLGRSSLPCGHALASACTQTMSAGRSLNTRGTRAGSSSPPARLRSAATAASAPPSISPGSN